MSLRHDILTGVLTAVITTSLVAWLGFGFVFRFYADDPKHFWMVVAMMALLLAVVAVYGIG